MTQANVILKVSISAIIMVLVVTSFFLYRFLFLNTDPLLQNQILPIPNLDLEKYEQIKGNAS